MLCPTCKRFSGSLQHVRQHDGETYKDYHCTNRACDERWTAVQATQPDPEPAEAAPEPA